MIVKAGLLEARFDHQPSIVDEEVDLNALLHKLVEYSLRRIKFAKIRSNNGSLDAMSLIQFARQFF